VHTGNMSCNLTSQGNKIWFVNSSSTSVQEHCLSLLIPVEKIDKQNVPTNRTTAGIGVPFTWKLVIRSCSTRHRRRHRQPGKRQSICTASRCGTTSISATGVDLSLVGYTITGKTTGRRSAYLQQRRRLPHLGQHPIVAVGRQFVIDLTVVLNDRAVERAGTQFVNTAKWDFGRLIGGVFYEPLPGENGISPPLTIAAPVLVSDKTGPRR
jgi:hypothetical protein